MAAFSSLDRRIDGLSLHRSPFYCCSAANKSSDRFRQTSSAAIVREQRTTAAAHHFCFYNRLYFHQVAISPSFARMQTYIYPLAVMQTLPHSLLLLAAGYYVFLGVSCLQWRQFPVKCTDAEGDWGAVRCSRCEARIQVFMEI